MTDIPSIKERIKHWDELYSKDGKRYGRKPSYFCRLMAPYLELNKPSKVLELGCGYGRDLFYLSQKIPRISFLGADASKKALALLEEEQKKYRIASIQCILDNCMQPSELEATPQYDSIFSHFFVHLFLKSEVKTIFKLASQLLKDNALFISSYISVADSKFGKGTSIEENSYACYTDRPWYFLHFWDEKEIYKVYSHYQFKIISLCEYIEKEEILGKIEENRAWFVVAQKK